MKYRTAVAAAIISALEAAQDDCTHHDEVEGTKSNGRQLNSKQKARADAVFSFYLNAIKNTLATTPFEGDTAEVDGYEPAPGR